VLLVVGHSSAETFDELFEGVKAMPWERYIPIDGAFRLRDIPLILSSIPSRTARAS
jgi:putative N6-adenine-specific DNA methylase